MNITYPQIKQLILFTLVTVLGLAVVSYVLATGVSIVLLFLFAIILAIGFTAFARTVSRWTRLPYGFSLATALSISVAGVLLFLSYFFPALTRELLNSESLLREISNRVDGLLQSVTALEQMGVNLSFSSLLEQVQSNSISIFNGVQNVFTQTSTAIFNALILLVVSIFLASQPLYYKRGLVAIVPEAYKNCTRHNLEVIYTGAKNWLLSRLASMAVISLLTYIGLIILNVPLAFSLAIAAGLLSFIPNLGPILSFIPALLVSLTLGTFSVVAVIILYLLIQLLESNLITPKIEQKLVSSPPALLLFMQLLFGTVLGFLGLLLAAPVLAIAMILWKEGKWQADAR